MEGVITAPLLSNKEETEKENEKEAAWGFKSQSKIYLIECIIIIII